MNKKLWRIGLFLIAAFLCCTAVSCSDDDDEPPTSTTETEPGPVEEPSNTINGYEYVDMGLSVKWASCNVGASSPEDYGNYYAWGEIEPTTEYTSENCATYKKEMDDIAGDPSYDVARVNWGSPWRLPTKDEFQELMDNCKWGLTTLNDIKGYLITSYINNNSIFLPVAGYRYKTLLYRSGSDCYYWSSTPSTDENLFAYCVSSRYSLKFTCTGLRYNGNSVRPVSD